VLKITAYKKESRVHMPSHVHMALGTTHVQTASGLVSQKQPKHLILPTINICICILFMWKINSRKQEGCARQVM